MPSDKLNVKVLGLSWLLENDKFAFDISSYLKTAENVPQTKRNILKFIASIFDPASVISPVLINLKILLQKLCVLKVNWDDLIPTKLALEWKNLLTRLLSAQPFCFNRYYFYNSIAQLKNVSLHSFCDASENAYVEVIYFLSENVHGEKYCCLVVAKTKIARETSWSKNVSIPKLKLLTCVLLTSLIHYVINSMENVLAFNDIYCWSDSHDVFTNNRVSKIRSAEDPLYWRHCPGKLNPANLPSRGILASKFNGEIFNLWCDQSSCIMK